MTIDPAFTIEGSPTGVDPVTGQMDGVEVTKDTVINLAITDLTDVTGATWDFIGKSENYATPTITPGGSPLGATATFTCPDLDGIAGGIRVTVSGVGGPLTYDGKFYTTGKANDYIAFYDGEVGWGYRLNEDLAAANAAKWTFDTGYFNVSVPGTTETTLYLIDFDDLPFANGVYGATGFTASGYVEVLIVDLQDSSSGDEETVLCKQRVLRYSGGNVVTQGSPSVDGISNMTATVQFVNGTTMAVKVTRASFAFTAAMQVRVRGQLYNRIG